MVQWKPPAEFLLPGFWSQGMQVESLRMKPSRDQFWVSAFTAISRTLCSAPRAGICLVLFPNSLPCPAAEATGNCLPQQTIWTVQQSPFTLGGADTEEGLPPLLSEILHLCFLSAVWFSCWLLSTSGFLFTPHSHWSPAKIQLLSQQCGLPLLQQNGRTQWQMTGALMFRRMMGQPWLRSFAKLKTPQIAGSTSREHWLLSELSFSEISWAGESCSLTKDITSGATTFKWQGLNVGTASILSGTVLGWVCAESGSEAQSAQSCCGDRHHPAPGTRTKVCRGQTGGRGTLCSDKEIPSELAQVLQSLQQLCKVMGKHQPPSGAPLKLCIARTAFVSCFWELRCSPGSLWDGWRGVDRGEGRKEGNEKILGCPQTSFPSGGIISIQVTTLVTLGEWFTLLSIRRVNRDYKITQIRW